MDLLVKGVSGDLVHEGGGGAPVLVAKGLVHTLLHLCLGYHRQLAVKSVTGNMIWRKW